MNELPFANIQQTPDDYSSTNVMARFVEALGFRFRWATEGLTFAEHDFRPDPSSMSMRELLEHLYRMAKFVNKNLGGTDPTDSETHSFEDVRTQTLAVYESIVTNLKSFTQEDFEAHEKSRMENETNLSFWFMLNGPISDSLTHVGQITTWRRIAGNPQPKGVDVYRGTTKF